LRSLGRQLKSTLDGMERPNAPSSDKLAAPKSPDLSIPATDIFTPEFLHAVRSSKSEYGAVHLKYGVIATYNPDTGQINFSLGGRNAVSFRMDESGCKVVEVSDWKGGAGARELAVISAAGGLRPEFLTELGISGISPAQATGEELRRLVEEDIQFRLEAHIEQFNDQYDFLLKRVESDRW
jgi:hypothetical protein